MDKTMRKWIIASLISVVIVLGGLIIARSTATNAAAQPLSEGQAIAKALEVAHQAGLQGQPKAIIARQMTLVTFAHLIESDIPPSAAKVGLSPATPVWVVGIRGTLQSTLPGGGGTFNNIFIALNAQTGETIITATRNPGASLPLPLP